MGLIEDEFSNPLISGIRSGRSNNTRAIRINRARDTVIRVAKGSPEVMVKISGFTKGASHLGSHLSYISRNGKIEVEDQNGAIYEDAVSITALKSQWEQEIQDGNPSRSNRRDTVRIVLSMPPGTDPDALKMAARQFSADSFGNHAYAFALHTDEKHPHVHLTVQMRGFNGDRLNPRRSDLQAWRETFAARLLDEGIDCVATPRTARNRSRSQRQSQKHRDIRLNQTLNDRAQKEAPRVRDEARDAIRAKTHGLVASAWINMARTFDTGMRRFNGPPTHYERYPKNEEGRRACRRNAALYQSCFGNARGIRAAQPDDRLRDVSSSEMVRFRQPPQGLLQRVSCDRLGRFPETHHRLRRERDLTGPDGRADGERKVDHAREPLSYISEPNRQELGAFWKFIERLSPMASSRNREKSDRSLEI